eukprot:CAMPEP_0183362630 /NCGR_PEP_ID=MMETSP0164_2-20130417/70614_1 /TAXON_ID=221442 /ORGANISM="Coccolithus pelagicus ssp braarudi, Strain PLY182g" /LENGTH=162 /DNA_ID=CAMNT_0025537545 /DNA_START=306 /DNA_END=791 /DNA_ORIENTATION=+
MQVKPPVRQEVNIQSPRVNPDAPKQSPTWVSMIGELQIKTLLHFRRPAMESLEQQIPARQNSTSHGIVTRKPVVIEDFNIQMSLIEIALCPRIMRWSNPDLLIVPRRAERVLLDRALHRARQEIGVDLDVWVRKAILVRRKEPNSSDVVEDKREPLRPLQQL